jgi:hypothetical protein
VRTRGDLGASCPTPGTGSAVSTGGAYPRSSLLARSTRKVAEGTVLSMYEQRTGWRWGRAPHLVRKMEVTTGYLAAAG